MNTPISNADLLRIGSVDFVSPNEIKVLLDIEAPNDVALNAGVPRPFPRINSYVLIPSENGFLVSQIEWITIERSQYPKRRGIQDFGVIDLPYPLRKMSLNPIGVLSEMDSCYGRENAYTFSRGIEVFPTVGDPVLLPTQNQLRSIVESGENHRVNIGFSPLAGNAKVSIDPDRLFGRHLAVLGNTGSGKSCSVAGLIRWSIEAAQRVVESEDAIKPKARFIILDPNGEYASAFSDIQGVHIWGVESNSDSNIGQLTVPIWLWNSEEWSAFTQASSKAQKPTLIQALRSVRSGQIEIENSKEHKMRNFLKTIISILSLEINAGNPWGSFPKNKNFYEKICKWRGEFLNDGAYNDDENNVITRIADELDSLINARAGQYPHYDFTRTETDTILELVKNAHHIFGGTMQDLSLKDADVPIPFTGDDLLKSIEANAEILNTTEYVETMLMRIKTLLSDAKLKKVISPDNDITLEQWLDEYVCSNDPNNGAVTIIDLSLIPAEIVHIITAVIARMTLEALQRYRRANNGKTLPMTLVMEEAHTFIRKHNENGENESASVICTKVFEKIAREGRKFGLGLVLSSQRPSELSPTVLSQCNTFLLHRISNDRDQELVNKLVPDNLRGLLSELPSLPSQSAILLGWAAELPVLIRMNNLKKDYRPRSEDPNYWETWTGESRNVDWKSVTDDWESE